FLVLDEVAQWPDTRGAREVFEAVTSAAGKQDCRMVLLTTAGDPAHWIFRELEHARTDLLWRVNEVEGAAPWLDPEKVGELRRRLSASSFARLYENRWTSSEDRLATIDDLRACATLAGPLLPRPNQRYAIGVDIGIVHDRTAAVVAHLEEIRSPEG